MELRWDAFGWDNRAGLLRGWNQLQPVMPSSSTQKKPAGRPFTKARGALVFCVGVLFGIGIAWIYYGNSAPPVTRLAGGSAQTDRAAEARRPPGEVLESSKRDSCSEARALVEDLSKHLANQEQLAASTLQQNKPSDANSFHETEPLLADPRCKPAKWPAHLPEQYTEASLRDRLSSIVTSSLVSLLSSALLKIG